MPDPPALSRSLPHMVCCDLNQRAGIPLSKALKNSGQQGGGLDDSCSIPITPETSSQATRPKKRSAQSVDAFQTWYVTPRRHVRCASTSTSSTTSGHTLPVHWKFSIYIYNAISFAQATFTCSNHVIQMRSGICIESWRPFRPKQSQQSPTNKSESKYATTIRTFHAQSATQAVWPYFESTS